MKKLYLFILLFCLGLFFYGCEDEKITVEFETNGGSVVETIVVNDVLDFKLPTAPTKEGYKFVGWFLDSDLTQAFSTLGSDGKVKLYAKWELVIDENHEHKFVNGECECGEKEVVEIKHTVTFMDGDVTLTELSVEVKDGEKVAVPEEIKKEMFTFVGWFTDSAFTTAYDFESAVTADLVLYAKWEEASIQEKNYTVSFENVELEALQVKEGEALPKPNDPEKEGFIFEGWFTDSACTVAYNFESAITADLVLYAKWTEVIVEPGIEIIVPNGQLEYYLDDTFKLEAIVSPASLGQEVTWRAMNRTKATIDEFGNVTIIAAGEATFRATSANDATLKTSVTITIKDICNPYALMEKLVVKEVVAQKITAYSSTTGYKTTIKGGIANYLFQDIDVIEKMIPVGNGNRPGTSSNGNPFSAKYVTVHDVGAAGDATANANYAVSPTNTVSWHYTVGNEGVYQHLPLNEVGFHAGDGTATPLSFSNSGVKAPDGDKTPGKITINQSTGYFQVNGVDSEVLAPTNGGRIVSNSNLPYTGINNYVNDEGYYMIGNTYWNSTYKTLSNRGGNLNSIGIESTVNAGSNIYLTWYYMAKLISTEILPRTGLTPVEVKQHNTFSGKDCPMTMRHANRWESFMDIVRFEYEAYCKFLAHGWKLELICDSEYVKENGTIISLPETEQDLTYQVRLYSTKAGFDETFTYTVKLPAASVLA